MVTANKAVAGANRLSNNFNMRKALHDFFPQNAQLHLGKTIAHTAVDPASERKMISNIRPVDDELIRIGDHITVAIR